MIETKWLTIAEASLLAAEMGLDRTHKTIRSWCRKGDVIAEKQTVQNGDVWVLDKDSLITKVNFEIEVRDQKERTRTLSEPVQTGSDQFEPVRTSADRSRSIQARTKTLNGHKQGEEEDANHAEPQGISVDSQIRQLENKVMTLSIDVGWREEALNRLREENENGRDTLQAQARYIGHLESDLMRLGGTPDQTFLSAPKPQEHRTEPENAPESNAEIVQPQRPHPDQTNLYTG